MAPDSKETSGFYRSGQLQHKRLVFRTLHRRGPTSRYKLADIMKLRYRTLRSLLSEMLAEGIIHESGNVIVRRGRAPIFLQINPAGGRVIGVALDSREVTGILTGLDLAPIHSCRKNVGKTSSRSAIQTSICAVIDELRQSPEGRAAPLLGIGYGEYGLVDVDRGVAVRSAYHRAWHGVPIRTHIEKRYDVPVTIDTEERCALLAEYVWRLTPEVQTALLVEVNDGIGFAVLNRGELFLGAHGFGGELGHIQVVPDGDICSCGSRGCLETVVSTERILAEARRHSRRGQGNKAQCGAGIDIRQLVEAADSGDATAERALGEAALYLGRALGIAINLFNPDAIVLRGELFQGDSQWLFNRVRREAAMCSVKEFQAKIRWCVSDLENAAALGASARVFAEVFGLPLSELSRPAGA